MFVDCHVHLLPPRRLAGLMKWMHGYYPDHPIPQDVTLETCIAHYDALDVDYVFNLVYPIHRDETEPVNAFNAELHRGRPWIIPLGGLHPDDPDKGAIVDRGLDVHGFLGFKLHPFIQRFDPLDPRMMPAYDRLSARGRPLVFHTGFEEFYGRSLPVETMEEIARTFPRLTIVFAHSLFPRFADAWRIVEHYPNVWLEMTNVFSYLWDGRFVAKEYDDERRLLLEGVGPRSERIMFGTDHPSGAGTLPEIYRTFDRVGLDETTKERLLGGTAERFVKRVWPDFTERVPRKPRATG